MEQEQVLGNQAQDTFLWEDGGGSTVGEGHSLGLGLQFHVRKYRDGNSG